MSEKGVFINSRKTFRFRAGGFSALDITAGFMGYIPFWAAQTRLYKLAVADGSIVSPTAEKSAKPKGSAQNEQS
jgi:hypothetical protein